jgi:hypothetical protein
VKFLIAVLLLAAAAPAAWAQAGINLFWNDCSETGATLQTFACDDNAGYLVLYVSVVSPQDLPQLAAVEVTLRMRVATGTVPDWWLTGAGQCRQGAISCSFDPAENASSCADIWQGTPNASVFSILPGDHWQNALLFRGAAAVQAGSELNVVADGSELEVCRLVIQREKSTGAAGCAGCEIEACLAVNECRLLQAGGLGNVTLEDPAASNWVVWQGDAGVPCPQSVPTLNRSWGAVKGMYR